MIRTSIQRSSTYKVSTGIARRLLMTAAVIALPSVANADFFVLDNPGDPNFNQLLGINDGRVIVGYFGDGTVVANNGYVLVPKNHYSAENFTNLPSGDFASQTQAIGINSRELPEIVGFYTDNATGFTHGFLDVEGDQLTVDDPKGVTGITTPTQNLLGINNNNKAAGFWTDNNGKTHGFVVDIKPKTHTFTFIEVGPNKFPGAVSTQVSGINNDNEICGFFTDAKGNSTSFFGPVGGKLTTFSVIIGSPVPVTQALGCNDGDEVVGTFTDFKGNVHGFFGNVFASGNTFKIFNAPGSKQTKAFGVQGTTINGVDNAGDIVGFFSDGAQVHGFVDFVQPNGNE